jgi:hypothetical protein
MIAASVAFYGFGAALVMIQVLKQCGDDVSRDNIMRQALNLKDFVTPDSLPGASINTSPTNYLPRRTKPQPPVAAGSGANIPSLSSGLVTARTVRVATLV